MWVELDPGRHAYTNIMFKRHYFSINQSNKYFICSSQEEGTRDKTAKLLLRHGADVNMSDDFGRTALSYVCEKRCNDILRIPVKEHNVDPDIADETGMITSVEAYVSGKTIVNAWATSKDKDQTVTQCNLFKAEPFVSLIIES